MKQYSVPRHILSRTFLRPLTARILLCCAVLCALLEVLALLEEASTILSRHLGIMGLLKFTGLHLPALIVEIMPLSVMIGALFTLLQMTLSSEIAVMRAAGLSTLNMYRYLLPAPLLLGVLACIIKLWIVPICEQKLNKWWNETATIAGDTSELPGIWFRSGTTITRIEQVSHGGHVLKDIAFYQIDPQSGLLVRDLHFPDLHFENKVWVSDGEVIETLLSDNKNQATIRGFSGKIPFLATPREIIDMTQEEVYYTPAQIWRILHRKAPVSLPPSQYLMAFFSAVFLPVQMAVMLLVALPVIYIPPRAGLRNPIPVYVMATGLGIVVLQGMISALGNAGSIPVLLAVSAGQIIAALFGLAWILRMEEK